MLDNVFDSKEIVNYIFSVDYIYNFLQIKLIWNEENENRSRDEKSNSNSNDILNSSKTDENSPGKNSNFKPMFLEGEFKEMFNSEETSISLVKLGMNFKKKQKLDYFSFNKQYENVNLYNSSGSNNDSFSYNKNMNNRKGSFNLNNNNQKYKKKVLGNNSSYDNSDEQSFYSNNICNNKSRRKNTYTFGQGLKNYGYNNEQSLNIVNEKISEINIKEENCNENNNRSSSYEKLAKEKRQSNDSNYKIQYKDNNSKEEIKGKKIYLID